MDVIAYVTQLFDDAIRKRVSDIHLEPQIDGLRIRQRIDGILQEAEHHSPEYAGAIISRLKVLTNLDIGERRLPQDGSMTLQYQGKAVDVRISTVPTINGEKVALRLLYHQNELARLDQLGIHATEQQVIDKLLRVSSGLVIVTGPTGSGKTTTLYAMLQVLNRVQSNVITLEDPIELKIGGVNQIQVNPRAGLTFAKGLRAILRQDPNVIMIGEVRDKETADIAISAALTGHLVLTTLHTKDAASAVTRLLDMGIASYRVFASLSGVVAQRLLRKCCVNCTTKGCHVCHGTGYYQRTGVFESFYCSDQLKEHVHQQVGLSSLKLYLKEQGFRSLYETALEKVKNGETTLDEILRVMGDVQEKETYSTKQASLV